ncbi:hypothetical protein ACWDO0_18580, partial [Nocardia rhamnosiphila]
MGLRRHSMVGSDADSTAWAGGVLVAFHERVCYLGAESYEALKGLRPVPPFSARSACGAIRTTGRDHRIHPDHEIQRPRHQETHQRLGP